MKRRSLILLVALALVLMITAPALAAPKVIMDNQELSLEAPPLMEQGRTLVPLRAFSEALGGSVTWDNATGTVTISKNDLEVRLNVKLDASAKIINGQTWVPLRFVSETLGAEVAWDQAAQTVTVTTKGVQNPVCVLGSDINFVPFEFYGPDGQITGFDIDLINAVSKESGLDIKIKDIKFPEIFPALNTAQIDGAISAITATEMRQQFYDFSIPYFLYGQCVVVRSDNETINGLEDLKGKKIGAQTGSTAYEEALKISNAETTGYSSGSEALQALENGTLDAVINDFPGTAYYLQQGYHAIKIVGETIANQPTAIVFPKDNAQLRDLVNDALVKLKENGEFDRIYKKWFGVEPPQYLPGSVGE